MHVSVYLIAFSAGDFYVSSLPPVECDTPQPLGLEKHTPLDITDASFEASSSDHTGSYYSSPHYARLNFAGRLPAGGAKGAVGGWKPADSGDPTPWVQVLLGRNAIVTGVITQGRSTDDGSQTSCWVTEYKVLYSNQENTALVEVKSDDDMTQVSRLYCISH